MLWVVARYGWSNTLGSRTLWVVARYGWSHDMGGRTLWVVASCSDDIVFYILPIIKKADLYVIHDKDKP